MDIHESEELAFTVAAVWREERVSCPHPDLLQAYETRSLQDGALQFLDFHLNESECPYCNAVLGDLRARQSEAESTPLSGLKVRLFRPTVTELRRVSGDAG